MESRVNKSAKKRSSIVKQGREKKKRFSILAFVDNILAKGLIFLVYLYQKAISPFLGQVCRFAPSCSHYSVEALQRFGAWKGSFLTLRRLLKCHPWHPGGVDPVPKE